jgi:hypothetical protein
MVLRMPAALVMLAVLLGLSWHQALAAMLLLVILAVVAPRERIAGRPF